MIIILIIILGLIVLVALIVLLGKHINAQKHKIRSETGVQKTEYITLGRIEQYIQIRGQDINNPIIIMLHGGPGNNMANYSYYWQTDLEQDYTVVHWDQRGCGNTYYRNKDAEKPTLDLLQSDLDELVDYLCTEYNKDKVIIMGHSWGTFPGGIYSGKNTDKVSAYIGVGQMLDFKKSIQVSAEEAIRIANTKGDTEKAKKMGNSLETAMVYQKMDQTNFVEFYKFLELKDKYLPSCAGMYKILSLSIFSPYITFDSLKWMFNSKQLLESNSEIYKELLSKELSMYNYKMQYEVPIIIITGDSDWTTPHNMAFDYYNDITAPKKEFITIENAGHLPFLDEPKEFSEELMKALRNVL